MSRVNCNVIHGKKRVDTYIKSHGSKVWPNDRYEIRDIAGNITKKRNLTEARDHVLANRKNLVPVKTWDKKIKTTVDKLFGPVPEPQTVLPEETVTVQINGTTFIVPKGSTLKLV